eukprot:GHVH01004485.1.p1 GENE.GHVH01004485.1~~GHVH01004485.1.p1  ORF type:complete len:2093 (-),score=248.26 GHVH01004485.1:101-6049(-)
MIRALVNVLKMSCMMCKRLRMNENDKHKILEAYSSSALTNDSNKLLALASVEELLKESEGLSEHISSHSLVVESWQHFRREALDILVANKQCPHCRKSFSGVRFNPVPKTDAGIQCHWNPNHQMPFDMSMFEHLSGTDAEDATNKSMNTKAQYAKRGVQTNSVIFQGRVLQPILFEIFNSPDKWVLEKIYPLAATLRKRGFNGAAGFFMKNLPVSGNQFRPFNQGGGFSGGGGGGGGGRGGAQEEGPSGTMHPRTRSFLSIMENAETYKDLYHKYEDSKQPEAWLKMDEAASELQLALNFLIDSTKSKSSADADAGTAIAIRQMLEKKQGAIRQRMMGKRVDFAARTVIAPDAYINTNEIGIPLEFAMKLNLQEAVNDQNLEYLKQLVRNGAHNYPGANSIIEGGQQGHVIKLDRMTDERRIMIADRLAVSPSGEVPTVVSRQLREGDVVIMNRQPSLHKPSMMAHFVRIVKGWRTFRLHYVNCGSYNADFDGDEMNMHLPQGFEAQAESRIIANSDCQYTVPKDGDVLRGLIQDHVLGGNFLTVRGTMLTREKYMQLLYIALAPFVDRGEKLWLDAKKVDGDHSFDASLIKSTDPYAAVFKSKNVKIMTEPPCIMKPARMWSGKQVVTSVIKTIVDFASHAEYSKEPGFEEDYKGINLTSKSKTPGDAWNGKHGSEKEEGVVIIRNSELLQGVFDKAQFGATTFGFVHYCHEALGPRIAGILLGCFARLCTAYLQIRGFSCCAGDFMMTSEGEHERLKMVERTSVGGVFIQEMFVEAVNRTMKWKDAMKNKFPLKQKYDTMFKAMLEDVRSEKLSDFIYEVSNTKVTDRIISKDGRTPQAPISEKKSTLKRGFLVDSAANKIRKVDETSPETVDSWDVHRARAIPSYTRDWRLRSREEVKLIADKLIKDISSFARSSDPFVKEALVRIWASTPEIPLYFPKTAALLGSEALWGRGQMEHIFAMREKMVSPSAPSPARLWSTDQLHPLRYPSSNSRITLPSGTVVTGDGAMRMPMLYPVSWCYSSRTSSNGEDFDDPSRYATHLTQVRNQGDLETRESGLLKKPFVPLPNEITRLRLQALCKEHFPGKERAFQQMLDGFFQSTMGNITSKNNDLVTGQRTLYKFPSNGFSAMITTGAKGSKVNYAMIAGMLSQQSLEGRRVPVMVSLKTLPSFARFDWGARAGGLITDRYLTGLRPQEYFFHCMAGREGLVDTAVKTANSGYLQRCVMKGLEGMCVNYDGTVRDSDGSIIQFLYGEDGVDPARCRYLDHFVDLLETPSLLKARLASRDTLKRFPEINTNISKGYLCPDVDYEGSTALSNPHTSPGIVSEKFFKSISVFEEKHCNMLHDSGRGRKESKKEAKHLKKLLLLKYRDCLMQPGEGVGCLAAQSMGEPATQMTLNTFHLAGHGAANVTLGIPRLKEILQVAGYAGTPVLYIPLKQANNTDTDLTVEEKAAEILKGFRRIPMTDLVHSLGIDASVYMVPAGSTAQTLPEFSVDSNAGAGEVEKYWSYEVTLQLENLDHFCAVAPKYSPTGLVNFILSKIVREWARRVNHNVGLYSLNATDTDVLQHQDEVDDAMDQVLNRKIRNVYEKKAARKERSKVAGLGFGTSKGGGARDEGDDAEFGTSVSIQSSWMKKGNDAEVDDETGASGQAEAGGEDSDVRSDASEDSFNDSDKELDLIDDVAEDGNITTKPTGDDNKNQNSNEEEEDEVDDGDSPEAKRKKFIVQKLKNDQLEPESMWRDDPQAKDAYWRLKNLPEEAFRFLQAIRVCRKTWRIVVKFAWPLVRCPHRINFLPYFVKTLKRYNLQDTPGVRNARVVGGDSAEVTKGCLEVVCDGSNFAWAHRLKDTHVDHNNLMTNDIKTVLQFYGIEACRTILIRELAKVFAVYGIKVDFRHLSLIGDSMTRTGTLRAFNRLGMTPHNSPLLQMSFETSMNFMTQALERAATDDLGSPASSIVTGAMSKVGTGAMRVLTKLRKEDLAI